MCQLWISLDDSSGGTFTSYNYMVFPGTKIEELFWKVSNGVIMSEVLIEEIIDFPINILTCMKDKKVKANLVLKILY